MRHEATRDLFHYWNTVRQERASPEREEIEPAAIRHILADTFILETGPQGRFRIRLSGTRLDALWLADQKDRDFLDLWGEDRHAVAAALWTVMDGTTPVVIGARIGPSGRPQADAEALLLPLRHRGKTHALVLGALTLAQPPAWIGLVPAERLRLVSLRVIDADRVNDLPILQRPRMDSSGAIIERRAHLTVYAGGR